MKAMARAFGGGSGIKECRVVVRRWKSSPHSFARRFASSPPEPSAEEIAAHDPYRGGEQEINGNPVDITENLRKRQGQVFTSKSYEKGWNRIFRKDHKDSRDVSDVNSSTPGSGR
mmetsp:Transcript_28779/g.40139  ORF Transcript_28779/g.40139 Transcript_28779/m.40139 type:complete len:115 (-) Transcript_28779:381-725(-)|eukprot:CAMPEP_0185280470 /NCGR_PEP_ID=MMETSP1359-20130426/66145_1 /TAXON_ID=552665 /ORGANISM="Bigelowiella longifila, Strain CCMP242" /LENGTH=114 /DNA_ID=CAMNT_0027875727 /DNA_START=79 /DNA_END=423 /DNA_ORIENTATION=-